MKNSIKIIREIFKTSDNKEVEGLTLVLEGRIKRIFDILQEEKGYNDNGEVLRDIISNGLDKMLDIDK
ncbi:hypothetical protein [Clostridium mediterraneense]|uniref:hypothetical protein n=1 Tax=Clostridium mediterraneense TaxID=1805472 RepID=UPI00082E885E|nr:hypothetical protein [Clostridium mediterraneense]